MRFLLSLTAVAVATTAFAADAKPAVTKLSAYPAALTIRGAEDAPQLVITGDAAGGRQIDMTDAAKYAVGDAKVVKVDPATGRVFPLANGSTSITAKANGLTTQVSVTISGM